MLIGSYMNTYNGDQKIQWLRDPKASMEVQNLQRTGKEWTSKGRDCCEEKVEDKELGNLSYLN